MKNFVQPGKVMDYKNATGSDIASGDGVVINDQLGVAAVDIADGESGAVDMEGVFALPKAPGVMTQGERLFWDTVLKRCTTGVTADAYHLAGMVWKNAASDDATVDCKLGPISKSPSSGGVSPLSPSTNLTGAPGSFADVAAVQAYLASVIPQIEARLDAVENKVNSVINTI